MIDDELAKPKDAVDFKPKITFSTIKNLISAVNRYPSSDSFLTKLRSNRPMTAVRLFSGFYTNPALTWDDLSVDHAIAYSRGGKTRLENAQLMHRGCNSRKGAR